MTTATPDDKVREIEELELLKKIVKAKNNIQKRAGEGTPFTASLVILEIENEIGPQYRVTAQIDREDTINYQVHYVKDGEVASGKVHFM